jgi:competence protein ComFC
MGVKKFLRSLSDFFFPYIPQCVCCGTEKGVEDYLCESCTEKMESLKAGEIKTVGIKAYSAYRYEGYAKKIVRGFKYNNKKWLSRFMGDAMIKAIFGGNIKPQDFSFICNVPLHAKKKKSRGYDQSEELAKRISETTGIPYINALKRIKFTKTQTKLTEQERRENIKGAFEKTAYVRGSALLVDDVLTTGATVMECAEVLKAAGAQSVTVLTFAKSVYGMDR